MLPLPEKEPGLLESSIPSLVNVLNTLFPFTPADNYTISNIIIKYWKHRVDAGIMLKNNLYLNTLLFADDQAIIQDSEDKLQKSVYILNQLSKDYNLKISTDKTKIMAFKRKHLVRSKI
jgi:hypothetical protein